MDDDQDACGLCGNLPCTCGRYETFVKTIRRGRQQAQAAITRPVGRFVKCTYPAHGTLKIDVGEVIVVIDLLPQRD